MIKRSSNRRLCAVQNCNRNRENSPSLVFAGIPKQTDRYEQWVKNLQLDETKLTKLSHICSTHFTSSQFTCPKKICLKKTAIPTILHGSEIQQHRIQQQPFVCPQSGQFLQVTANETVYQVQVSDIFTPEISNVKRIAPKIVNVELTSIKNSTSATGNQNTTPKNRKNDRLFFRDSSESTTQKYSKVTKTKKLQSDNSSSLGNCYTCKLKSRQIKRLHDQLRYSRRKMSGMKKHDARNCVQDLVEKTPRLTSHAKVFLQSQFYRSVDSIKNKRKNYNEAEKTMAVYLWKQVGTKGYEALKKMGFLIPTIRTLTSINNIPSDTNNIEDHTVHIDSSNELHPSDCDIVTENNCASNNNLTYQIQSVQVQEKHIITIDGNPTNTTVHLESIVIPSPPL